MYQTEQAYQQSLQGTNFTTRTISYNSGFVERTTWVSDISPPTPGTERTLDWKEFLAHSRFDHDAAICMHCMHSSQFNDIPATPITGHNLPGVRSRLAPILPNILVGRTSMLAKITKFRFTRKTNVRCSSWQLPQPVNRCVHEKTVLGVLPPVLPALPPSSPLFKDCDLLV